VAAKVIAFGTRRPDVSAMYLVGDGFGRGGRSMLGLFADERDLVGEACRRAHADRAHGGGDVGSRNVI
jgi:hypothetical protein